MTVGGPRGPRLAVRTPRPDVVGQDLGGLIAELAKQHARAGRNPEREVPISVLAELQLGAWPAVDR
jgi:hypothetical protein